MARTKRLAKEAKAAELCRQLAELEDNDDQDSPVNSDVDPDQADDHPTKDMGAFVAAAVSFFPCSIFTFAYGLFCYIITT